MEENRRRVGKRKLSLARMLLPAAVAVLCLAGCRGKAEIVTQEDDRIILTVLAGQSTADAGMEDMIDEWMEGRYPNVKLEWECVDWGESFDAQVRSRFAAGDIPDVIVGKAQDVNAYVGTGNLAPIPDACANMLEKKALDAVTVRGKAYGMPFNAWYQGVIYNKEIFQSFGLGIPKTLDELERAVAVLEAGGITPFAGHFQESWSLGNTTMQFMMNEIFCKNPEWGEQFRSGGQNFTGSRAIRQCMENNRYMLEHSWEDVLNIDQYECDNRFANGQAAMYLTGSWSLQFAEQYSGRDEFGIFPYPNRAGDAKLLRETNLTFMMSAVTPHDELIGELFYGILSDWQLQGEILDYTQTQPVVRGFAPAFRSCIQDDIDEYERNGQVIDVAVGNNQLVWSYQNAVAAEQRRWLDGQVSLEDVLRFADSCREESANE